MVQLEVGRSRIEPSTYIHLSLYLGARHYVPLKDASKGTLEYARQYGTLLQPRVLKDLSSLLRRVLNGPVACYLTVEI